MFTELASVAQTAADSQGLAEVSFGDSASRYRVTLCAAGDPVRADAEAFVRKAFYRTHHACVRTFMPSLLLLTDAGGALHGVAGCRAAAGENLFLERYLRQPIECVISTHTGMRVRRSEIVEVGNFACANASIARRFAALLPYYLLDRNLTWIVFTATGSVRRILQQVDARCVELAAADGACVEDGPDDWGRYYANDPRVMAGYLPLARRSLTLWGAGHAD